MSYEIPPTRAPDPHPRDVGPGGAQPPQSLGAGDRNKIRGAAQSEGAGATPWPKSPDAECCDRSWV